MFLLGFPYNAEARAGEKQTKTKTQTKKKKKRGLSKNFTLNKIILYMCHSGFPAITECL